MADDFWGEVAEQTEHLEYPPTHPKGPRGGEWCGVCGFLKAVCRGDHENDFQSAARMELSNAHGLRAWDASNKLIFENGYARTMYVNARGNGKTRALRFVAGVAERILDSLEQYRATDKTFENETRPL